MRCLRINAKSHLLSYLSFWASRFWAMGMRLGAKCVDPSTIHDYTYIVHLEITRVTVSRLLNAVKSSRAQFILWRKATQSLPFTFFLSFVRTLVSERFLFFRLNRCLRLQHLHRQQCAVGSRWEYEWSAAIRRKHDGASRWKVLH